MSLIFKPVTHTNPNARVKDCSDSTCGNYRRYRQGGSWHGIYLPKPTDWDAIFIEHEGFNGEGFETLMKRINADHQRRSIAALSVAA